MLEFNERVVVITGAAAGLGLAYAKHLARAGATVVLSDIAASVEEQAASLLDQGFLAEAIVADVGDEVSATGLIERVIKTHGRIDGLINNAGNTAGGPLDSVTTAQMQSILAVHLFGSLWTMRAVLPHMRANGYGRIVNTGSALGAFGLAEGGAYVAAKAAVIGLSKTAALENLESGVKINVICPIAGTALASGFFDANPDLKGSRLRTDSVAPIVSYLIHETCTVTGKVFSAAGGRFAAFFTNAGQGVFQPDLQDDQVADRLGAIMNQDSAITPASAMDEFVFLGA